MKRSSSAAHSDSTWPNTRQIAEAQMSGLDAETVEMLVRGNAKRMLRLA